MTGQTLTEPPREPLLRSQLPLALAGLLGAVLLGVAIAVNPRIGIGVLVIGLYVPVAFLNLALGAVIWMPLSFLDRVPSVGLLSTLLLIAFAFAWLGALPNRTAIVADVLRAHRTLFAALVLFLLWVGLSLLWAADVPMAAAALLDWVLVAATFTLLGTAFTSDSYAWRACAAFVVGGLLSVAIGFVPGANAGFEITADEASRFSGAVGEPNYLAAGLVPAMAIAAAMATVARSTLGRGALIAAAGALAIGLVSTGSRGGIVAAGVAIAAALILARGRRLQLGALVALGLTVAGLWLVTSSSETVDRLKTFDSGTGREDLWQVAWRMTEDNVATGVGAANFSAESGRYVRQPGQLERADLVIQDPHTVHNVYLQALAELGVVGFVLLLAVLGATLHATWSAISRFDAAGARRLSVLTRGLLVAQISMLSASMFLSNGYDIRLWVLLALGPAMAAISRRKRVTPA
jgi:O-antigen ligase